MGRLTLNVLLSFAQFEPEVTGERIRDKIAASKRKGMWMGGVASLGYDVRERRLVGNPTEGATVRQTFERYLELGSVLLLNRISIGAASSPRSGCRKAARDLAAAPSRAMHSTSCFPIRSISARFGTGRSVIQGSRSRSWTENCGKELSGSCATMRRIGVKGRPTPFRARSLGSSSMKTVNRYTSAEQLKVSGGIATTSPAN
jgi:hypothetical protein